MHIYYLDEKGKFTVMEEERVMEGESDTSDESWEGDSETDESVSITDDYGGEDSDEEFAEIRKEMAELKKNRRHEEEEYNKWVVVEHERMQSQENNSEEDGEFAYTEPRCAVKKRVNEVFNTATPGKDIKWKVGLIFESKKEVKDAVREFSIASGRPLRYKLNDLRRLSIICAEGCPFKMWVSYMKEVDGWQIRSLLDEHNCVYEYSNKLVSAQYLAHLYGSRIRRNPGWKIFDMQEEFKRVLKLEVGKSKACRVRKLALSDVKEEMRKHYAGLRKFGGEILRSNKDNTVRISTTRLNEEDPPQFQRFYVCYSQLKLAWKAGCRPVLGLDGCFLKTVCGGQLLSAIGRDANNSIFPVAMGVVEGEKYDSWRWFLQLLQEDLDFGNGCGYTLISDQQKGLDKAVRELLPHVHHGNCTRHIISNLMEKHGSEAIRNGLWCAATATHPEAFRAAMGHIERLSKEAAERLGRFDPKVWSKAFFDTNCKTDSTENNMSECFNSWILRTRYMPIIEMLTEIHDLIMVRLHERRDAMINVDCVVVPRIKSILDDAVKQSCECSVLWDGNNNYQVKWRGAGFCVNLDNKTCSCRVWDLTGVPCLHAVSAIQKMRLNPVDFVSHYFKKETYMKTYSYGLDVLRGEPFWEDVHGDTVLPSPIVKKLRGRPKKQRRRERWEGGSGGRGSLAKVSKLSRVGRIMHCKQCGGAGHNIRKCPKKEGGFTNKEASGKKRKKGFVEEEVQEEVQLEMERIALEEHTGETYLMEEAMELHSTPRRSQRLAETQSTLEEGGPSMTTDKEGLTRRKGKGNKVVKAFKAPRKK